MSARPAFHCANRVLFVALLVLASFILTRTARAQALYGSITGTVTDQTGAVVPNITVLITNQSTGAARSVTSDAQGNYALRDVVPDAYQVSVQPSGNFAAFTQRNIQVNVNREVRVNVALQVGAVAQEVTVSTAPPELQTDTADVNHQITETQLTQLPITSSQGRQFQNLYTIVPGAAAVAEQNSTASNPSRAMSANFNGVSENGNTTRIDGAINYYGWLPYLIAYVPPADSIQNVNIVTNSFNAEQGLAGGASINITTKSGTANLHGSAWEYYQDAAFNARAYTATRTASPTVPKNIFNEYGFNVGGPVYIPKILTGRKKLFFFENFERTTRRQLISGLVSVPDTTMLGGDFSEVTGTTNGILYDPQPMGVRALICLRLRALRSISSPSMGATAFRASAAIISAAARRSHWTFFADLSRSRRRQHCCTRGCRAIISERARWLTTATRRTQRSTQFEAEDVRSLASTALSHSRYWMTRKTSRQAGGGTFDGGGRAQLRDAFRTWGWGINRVISSKAD